jgi:hypothetical protein
MNQEECFSIPPLESIDWDSIANLPTKDFQPEVSKILCTLVAEAAAIIEFSANQNDVIVKVTADKFKLIDTQLKIAMENFKALEEQIRDLNAYVLSLIMFVRRVAGNPLDEDLCTTIAHGLMITPEAAHCLLHKIGGAA